MVCTKHQETEAIGTCIYCGKAYCKDCLVEVDGKMYCKDDLTRVFNEAKTSNSTSVQAQTPNIVINNANSNVNTNNNMPLVKPKSKLVALLLCIFLGYFGAHCFYTGKFGVGIIYIFTFGLLGIGILFDLIRIIIGSYRDKWGYVLV